MTKLFKTKHTDNNLARACLLHRISVFSLEDKPLLISNGLGEIEKIFLENFINKPLEHDILKHVQKLNFKLFDFWLELSQKEDVEVKDILEIIKSREDRFNDFKIQEEAELKHKTPEEINQLIKLFNIRNSYPGVSLYEFLDEIK